MQRRDIKKPQPLLFQQIPVSQRDAAKVNWLKIQVMPEKSKWRKDQVDSDK